MCTCIPRPCLWANSATHSHTGGQEVYSAWMEASTRICPSPAPCQSSYRRTWFSQSPHLSGEKSSGAPKYTAPLHRLAEIPASSTCRATTPMRIYMSAMQVTPEAIISASPRPVAAAMDRSSHLASAGKMKSLSQLWRSCPPPYPRMRVMGIWVWQLTRPGIITLPVQSMVRPKSPWGRLGPT